MVIGLVLCAAGAAPAGDIRLDDAQAMEIGRRIWRNECAGTVEGLTSWNKGEEFPSLGIAHFIWYPEGRRGPFEESFPGLVRYLKARGEDVPLWIEGACPWRERSDFIAALPSPQMKQLRNLLVSTVAEQARFAVLRLDNALPKILAAAPPARRAQIAKNFQLVADERLGPYALVDYVNFKGEGISPTERYSGEGWGLLQVLEGMRVREGESATAAFARSADEVLTRRVALSPPARNEAKWLPGWRNRLATYSK
jgi:hypothetical protein